MRAGERASGLRPRASARRWIGLGLVVALALGFGCGGAQAPTDWTAKLAKENEITALWTQIRDWRREAHLNLDPTPADLFSVRSASVAAEKQVCVTAHEVPQTCVDVCDLSVAICDNAEAICAIAADLGAQDDYAQEKCASAKASCRESKQRCCQCESSEATP